MENLHAFFELFTEYKDVAHFAVIYLKETHASDGWFPITNNVQRRQARVLEDRIEGCRELIELWSEHVDGVADVLSQISFLVDNMRDELRHKFLCDPERLYIVEGHRVVFQGDYGPWGYDLKPVEQFLKNRRAQQSRQ
jgi:hypothetical protein